MAAATAELIAYWQADDGCEVVEVDRPGCKPLRVYFHSPFELAAMLSMAGVPLSAQAGVMRDLVRCRNADLYAEPIDEQPPPDTDTRATGLPPAAFPCDLAWRVERWKFLLAGALVVIAALVWRAG
jgi:hypothetical protein